MILETTMNDFSSKEVEKNLDGGEETSYIPLNEAQNYMTDWHNCLEASKQIMSIWNGS